ncbi:MAG: acetoin utilization deacetylase AcuC-like enzyme [Gammaproteobacteria bacterium]|jgi:acetoin utilization deacetylase AcuC-like enzyme
MPTGFAFDQSFLNHNTGPGHPECAERATAIMSHLDQQQWIQDLIRIAPKPADEIWIETVHTGHYRERANAACKSGEPYLDSLDVAISSASYDVALLAAGAPLELADAMISGKINNGFALVRPPGHHAENNTALGFCLFNNVAILARYLQAAYGLEKIAIIDWDVHHGNGTQHTFESDPSVMYVSTHQYPFYPGTGSMSETGEGRGKASTLNCPMVAGATDAHYEAAFNDRILPALDRFGPQAVLISAGFDAHADDPLAGILLSTAMYSWMTLRLIEVADKHAQGRIISVLEGGYNLSRIGECVAAHLHELSGSITPHSLVERA